MSEHYPFAFETYFPNGFQTQHLMTQFFLAGIATPCIHIFVDSSKIVHIEFSAALSAGDQAIMNAVVAGYSPPEEKIVDYYDAVVDVNYTTKYQSIAAAFADGHSSVFVRTGQYLETADINIPVAGQLIGESQGKVIIVLYGTNSVRIDGSAGVKYTGGTFALNNLGKTITGTGTTFTSDMVGQYILVGTNYYEIATFVSTTELTLKETYVGRSIISQDAIVQPMNTGPKMENMIIHGYGTSVGLYLRAVRHASFKAIACLLCTTSMQVEDCADNGFLEFISNFAVSNGVVINNTRSMILAGINIFNSAGHGICITGNSMNLEFLALAAENNLGDGVRVEGTTREINFNGPIARNNNDHGIWSDVNTSRLNVDSGNIVYNLTTGLDLHGSHNSITGCVVEECGGKGIDVGIKGICDGNQVINCGSHGIYTPANSVKSTISNNMIEGCVGCGIQLLGGFSVVASNTVDNCDCGIRIESDWNNLGGNSLYGCTNEGVYVEGDNNVCNDLICTNNGSGLFIHADSDKTLVSSSNLTGNTGAALTDNGTNTVTGTNIVA